MSFYCKFCNIKLSFKIILVRSAIDNITRQRRVRKETIQDCYNCECFLDYGINKIICCSCDSIYLKDGNSCHRSFTFDNDKVINFNFNRIGKKTFSFSAAFQRRIFIFENDYYETLLETRLIKEIYDDFCIKIQKQVNNACLE